LLPTVFGRDLKNSPTMYHGAVKYAAQIARLRITYARTATLLPHSGASGRSSGPAVRRGGRGSSARRNRLREKRACIL